MEKLANALQIEIIYTQKEGIHAIKMLSLWVLIEINV